MTTPSTTHFGTTRGPPAEARRAAASATLGVPTAAAVRESGFGTVTSASSVALNACSRTANSTAAPCIPASTARRSIVAKHSIARSPTTSRTTRTMRSAVVPGRTPSPTTTSPIRRALSGLRPTKPVTATDTVTVTADDHTPRHGADIHPGRSPPSTYRRPTLLRLRTNALGRRPTQELANSAAAATKPFCRFRVSGATDAQRGAVDVADESAVHDTNAVTAAPRRAHTVGPHCCDCGRTHSAERPTRELANSAATATKPFVASGFPARWMHRDRPSTWWTRAPSITQTPSPPLPPSTYRRPTLCDCGRPHSARREPANSAATVTKRVVAEGLPSRQARR